MTEGKTDIVCLCEYAGRICCILSTVNCIQPHQQPPPPERVRGCVHECMNVCCELRYLFTSLYSPLLSPSLSTALTSTQQNVRDNAEAPAVYGRPVGPPAQYLRSDIRRTPACRHQRVRHTRPVLVRVETFRKPKVCQLHRRIRAVVTEENVLRLEVSVHDASVVAEAERLGDGPHDVPCLALAVVLPLHNALQKLKKGKRGKRQAEWRGATRKEGK